MFCLTVKVVLNKRQIVFITICFCLYFALGKGHPRYEQCSIIFDRLLNFSLLFAATLFLSCTEGDSIREGLWHQKFTKMATSNSLSFMVLFMCKKHVIKHIMNIWTSQVYLSLGIIKKFQKISKKKSKKIVRSLQN